MSALSRTRFFLAYSHDDSCLAQDIALLLRRRQAILLWDEVIPIARPFQPEIINLIRHAHVFMPLITDRSLASQWVQQEIGVAVGLGSCVAPLCYRIKAPPAFIGDLNGIMFDNPTDLPAKLSPRAIAELLKRHEDSHPLPRYDCAVLADDRGPLLAHYTNRALRIAPSPKGSRKAPDEDRLRQYGAFTSFCLPDLPHTDPAWDYREGRRRRSDGFRDGQRAERQALEAYARRFGCDLLICPTLELNAGPLARAVRLRTVGEFLLDETISDQMVRVALWDLDLRGNLLVLGDWFFADSATPDRHRGGYLHTLCTSHPTLVAKRRDDFDDVFTRLYERQAPARANLTSRIHAATVLDVIIEEIRASLPPKQRNLPQVAPLPLP